jgi:hypothetical protein
MDDKILKIETKGMTFTIDSASQETPRLSP